MAALTWIDGAWHEGNPKIIGATAHAAWLGSIAFDGARTFDGVTPDLDRHCQRVVRSCRLLGLNPNKTVDEVIEIARDGVRRYPADAELYIRPMFFAGASAGVIMPDPDSTEFVTTITEAPMPDGIEGFSATLSPLRRPAPDTAPTDAKASCLYPNGVRALMEAQKRGFRNAVMCDQIGNVSEFASANIWLVRDGVAITPAPNGTLLNGITRQRLIGLLRADGVEVVERSVRPEELLDADEIFSSGNYSKVSPVTRYEDRDLQPGPVYRRARELYWDWSHTTK